MLPCKQYFGDEYELLVTLLAKSYPRLSALLANDQKDVTEGTKDTRRNNLSGFASARTLDELREKLLSVLEPISKTNSPEAKIKVIDKFSARAIGKVYLLHL